MPSNTTLERLVNKASGLTAKMFNKPKVKRLSKEAANVQQYLRSLASTNVNLADTLTTVLGLAFGEKLALRDATVPVVPGAVVFAVSKEHSGRHGYALRRPFMVVREDGGVGVVRGIRFHSGNVGKKIDLKDTRPATVTETKQFFRNNWDAKRANVLSILG